MKLLNRQDQEQRRQTRLQDLFEQRKRAVLGIPAAPLRDLPELLRELQGLTDQDWGLYAFAREALRGRFTTREKLELIDGAIRCGEEYARRYREEFPGASPQEIAEGLGLNLLFPELPQDGGGRVLFARFIAPDTIQVFGDAVRKARQALAEDRKLAELLGQTNIQWVLLAHELFHWVEEEHQDTIFTQVTRVDLRPLGLFHHHSRILCLGEVAAMAFAKELLGLPYSPYLYDIFLLSLYNHQAACNLAAQIGVVVGAAAE